MKLTASKLIKTFLLVFLSLTFINSSIIAKTKFLEKGINNDQSIENLRNGINSENYGLCKSAIYMAGKYKIKAVVSDLLKVLKESKDIALNKLIVKTLHQIGDQEGMQLVYKIAREDDNIKMRRLCAVLYNDYIISNNKNELISKIN